MRDCGPWLARQSVSSGTLKSPLMYHTSAHVTMTNNTPLTCYTLPCACNSIPYTLPTRTRSWTIILYFFLSWTACFVYLFLIQQQHLIVSDHTELGVPHSMFSTRVTAWHPVTRGAAHIWQKEETEERIMRMTKHLEKQRLDKTLTGAVRLFRLLVFTDKSGLSICWKGRAKPRKICEDKQLLNL